MYIFTAPLYSPLQLHPAFKFSIFQPTLFCLPNRGEYHV